MNILIAIGSALAFVLAVWFGHNRAPKYPQDKIVRGPVKRRSF